MIDARPAPRATNWALLAAAGTLTIIPGAFVIYFVRHHIAKGFAWAGFE